MIVVFLTAREHKKYRRFNILSGFCIVKEMLDQLIFDWNYKWHERSFAVQGAGPAGQGHRVWRQPIGAVLQGKRQPRAIGTSISQSLS